jgi:hypothetical protein
VAFADFKNDFAFRCVLDIGPADEQRARLATMDVGELEALRAALKQARAWPRPTDGLPGATGPLAAGEGRLPD